MSRGMFGVRGSGDTSGYGGLEPPSTPTAEVGRSVRSVLDDLLAASESADEVTLRVHRDQLIEIAQVLRDDPALRFELCLGVSGVHYPDDHGRELHAVYPLLSITHNRRVLLEVTCPDSDPHVPSLFSVYPTTDWHERETYDFFGVIFDGHPGLMRIEMPDDWEGHPQRKDYPLGGIPVEYHGATVAPPDQRRSYH